MIMVSGSFFLFNLFTNMYMIKNNIIFSIIWCCFFVFRPIIFCLDSDPSFEANFVLATLADVSTQVSCSQRSTQTAQSKSKDSRYVNH